MSLQDWKNKRQDGTWENIETIPASEARKTLATVMNYVSEEKVLIGITRRSAATVWLVPANVLSHLAQLKKAWLDLTTLDWDTREFMETIKAWAEKWLEKNPE